MAVIPKVNSIQRDCKTLAKCLLYNAVSIISKRRDKVSKERAEFLIKVLKDLCMFWGISIEKEMLMYAESAFKYGDPHIESTIEIHRINSFDNQLASISAIKVTCIEKWCSLGPDAEEFMGMYRRALKLLLITWGWDISNIHQECADLTDRIREQRRYFRKLK